MMIRLSTRSESAAHVPAYSRRRPATVVPLMKQIISEVLGSLAGDGHVRLIWDALPCAPDQTVQSNLQ